MDFKEFPKIPRLFEDCVITEKIDGTNSAIYIEQDIVRAASRTRLLTLDADHFNFCRWVTENSLALIEELGPGVHFGEWWGKGIQRGYDVPDKRFSLFNVARWENAPLKLCRVVPVIYRGLFLTEAVGEAADKLKQEGSLAAPGYMFPEGVVIFHEASRHLYKFPFDKVKVPRGL